MPLIPLVPTGSDFQLGQQWGIFRTAMGNFQDSNGEFLGQQWGIFVERKESETIDFPVFSFFFFCCVSSASLSLFDVDEKKKGALYSEKVSRNLLAFRSELFRVQNRKTCKLRNSDFSSSLFHLRRNGYGDEKKKRRTLVQYSQQWLCLQAICQTY